MRIIKLFFPANNFKGVNFMYLLKRIQVNPFDRIITTTDGLTMVKLKDSNQSKVLHCFWGEINFTITHDAPKNIRNGTTSYIFYANEYDYQQLEDGLINLHLTIGAFEPDNVEGYILFIRNEKDIKTNGQKLFGRFPSEIVVVLKNGEYIELSGEKIEVMHGMLIHNI